MSFQTKFLLQRSSDLKKSQQKQEAEPLRPQEVRLLLVEEVEGGYRSLDEPLSNLPVRVIKVSGIEAGESAASSEAPQIIVSFSALSLAKDYRLVRMAGFAGDNEPVLYCAVSATAGETAVPDFAKLVARVLHSIKVRVEGADGVETSSEPAEGEPVPPQTEVEAEAPTEFEKSELPPAAPVQAVSADDIVAGFRKARTEAGELAGRLEELRAENGPESAAEAPEGPDEEDSVSIETQASKPLSKEKRVADLLRGFKGAEREEPAGWPKVDPGSIDSIFSEFRRAEESTRGRAVQAGVVDVPLLKRRKARETVEEPVAPTSAESEPKVHAAEPEVAAPAPPASIADEVVEETAETTETELQPEPEMGAEPVFLQLEEPQIEPVPEHELGPEPEPLFDSGLLSGREAGPDPELQSVLEDESPSIPVLEEADDQESEPILQVKESVHPSEAAFESEAWLEEMARSQSTIRQVNAEHSKYPWRGIDLMSDPTTTEEVEGQSTLFSEAVGYFVDSVKNVQRGELPDLSRGEQIVESLVASLQVESLLLLEATDRLQGFAISHHTVNVTVLALRVAQALSLTKGQQRRIGLAALLHEVGVSRLPDHLTRNAATLDMEELNALRQRPMFSHQALQSVESGYSWLPEVVGQVYEREDGSGFPLGLSGEAILEEAKIIGIVDVFDACTHARPHREGWTGYQTLFELTTDYASAFPDRILKALIRSVSLYPYNEFVELDSGEIGRVVEINRENLSRPQIEVMIGNNRRPLSRPYVLDLSVQADRYIARPLKVSEMPSSFFEAKRG